MRMSRIKGRVDDMLIIRGVNVFPTEIESVLLTFNQLTPHYQVVIERDGALDRFEVHCELTQEYASEISGNESAALSHLVKEIGHMIKNTLGVSVVLRIQPPNSLTRSEGKAIRIVDNRGKAQAAI